MRSHIAQSRSALIAGGLLAVAVAGARPLAAQQPHPMVRIAVPDSFPTRSQQPALLLRTGTDPLEPVILLNKAKLDEDALAAALVAVDVLLRQPIDPRQTQVVNLAMFKHARPVNSPARALAAGYLKQLRTRPVTRIGNIGRGRWMQIPAPTR